VLNLDY